MKGNLIKIVGKSCRIDKSAICKTGGPTKRGCIRKVSISPFGDDMLAGGSPALVPRKKHPAKLRVNIKLGGLSRDHKTE